MKLVPALVLAFAFSPSVMARFETPIRPQVVGGEIQLHPDAMSRSTVRLVILTERDERSLCTGSLLSESIVLTAAHCLANDSGTPMVVRIDFFGNKGLSEYRMGNRYLLHHEWRDPDSGARSDIALLHFNGGLPAGNSPARLLAHDILSFRTQSQTGPLLSTIAGYGAFDPSGEVTPDDQLRTVVLEVGAHEKDLVELKRSQPLASGCYGDSGGPAFYMKDGVPYVWGVASYVTEPYCQSSTYYTNVRQYRDWIGVGQSSLASAPDRAPQPRATVRENELDSFLKAYDRAKTDASRLQLMDAWLGSLGKLAALDLGFSMEVLLQMETEAQRLRMVQKLAPYLDLTVKQRANLVLMFNEPPLRQQAYQALDRTEVGYLQDE